MKLVEQTHIDNVKAGDILAHDLADDSGNKLLTAGFEFTQTSINQLKRRGIDVIPLEKESMQSQEELAELQAEIESRLKQRFRKVINDPQMRSLMEMIMAYQSGKYS